MDLTEKLTPEKGATANTTEDIWSEENPKVADASQVPPPPIPEELKQEVEPISDAPQAIEPDRAFVKPTEAFESDQSTSSDQLPVTDKGLFTTAFLPGERQEELQGYFRSVANAEYSQEAADEIIQDMINSTGDFAEGEYFEGIDPTLALKQLVAEYPDPNPFKIAQDSTFFSYDIMDEYRDSVGPVDLKTPMPPMLTPPKYSDGAERLKKYLRNEKYAKENPFLSFFDQTVNGIKNGFKDIPTGLNKTAWHGVNTMLSLLNWGTGEFVELAPAVTDMTPEQAKELRAKIYALSSYIVEPQPLTLTGNLTAAGAEAYLAYVTGTKVYSAVAPHLAKWVPKMAAALKTPSLNIAASEAIGSGTITSGEMRWATFFSDLGADNKVVESLKHAEDETVFQERWKSFIDGTYSGPAFASMRPVLGVFGTSAYILYKASQKGVDLTKKAWNKPRAREALNAGSNLFVRIRQNYPKPRADREKLDTLTGSYLDKLKQIQEESAKRLEELTGVPRSEWPNPDFPPDVSLQSLLKDKKIELEGTKVIHIPKTGMTEFDEVLKTIDADSMVSFIEKSGDFDWLASKQDIFNLKHIDDAEVKNTISGLADHFDNLIDLSQKPNIKSLKEGVEIHDLLRSQIAEGVGEEGVDAFIRDFAQGTQATTGTLLAIKMYMHESMKDLGRFTRELSESLHKGIPLTDAQRVAFSEKYFRSIGRLVADRTIANSSGRALQIQKMAQGSEEYSKKIIDSFEEGNSLESTIIALANSDLKATSEIIRRTRMAASFDMTKSAVVTGLLSGPSTLTAVPIGLCCYIGARHGETWLSAGISPLLKPFYKKGIQNPITVGEARAEGFGLLQAGFEFLNGAGYWQRSAINRGLKAGRTLDSTIDDRALGLGQSMGKEIDRLTGKPITLKLPILGEFNLQKGITEEALSDIFPNVPKEHIPGFLKFMINGFGAVVGTNARAIMSQDGYFRTFLERMTMHGESYAMARKRLSSQLPKDETGRAIGELDPKEVLEEAFRITKNLPPSIEKKMRHEGTVGLMQEKAPWLIKKSDEWKNTTSSSASNGAITDVGLDDVADFAKNTGSLYMTNNFSFQKTSWNIFKQSLTERGMYKLASTLLSGKNRKLFMTDQRYASDVLARTVMGTTLVAAGVALTYKAGQSGFHWASKNFFEPLQEHIKMEGIESNLPKDRYARKIQGRFGPEVILTNTTTGVETAIPINRLDVVKMPLILGSIFGSTLAALNEAEQEVAERGWTPGKHRELKDEIIQKFGYAMGNMVLDSPMMQGLKETSQLIPGWGNDNWNWTKEASTFIGDSLWHNSILKSLRSGVKKTGDEFRMGSYSDRVREWGDVPEGSKFTTKLGADVPVQTKRESLKIGPVYRALQTLKDIQERVGFMDIETDPDNPVVGSLLYQMVDPEGNLIRYIPGESKSKIAQGLKILALPFYPKVIPYTNTTTLMEKLEIPYDDPKTWETGTKAPLSAEQRYVWAVHYGRLNKDAFGRPEFIETIKTLKRGIWDKSQQGRVEKQTEKIKVDKILKNNKKIALHMMLDDPRNAELRQYWATTKTISSFAE